MKMVKSLLLGSAASLVAVAGAQAADLPVKAKAVEYVKVCSLYGAGFYYIPGTDTCIKIGGFVRFDTAYSGDVSGATPFVGSAGLYNRAQTTYYEWRARTMLSMDVRSQTEYGTLRSYARFGYQFTTGSATNGVTGDNASAANGNASWGGTTDAAGRSKDGVLYAERAFIQFAGFTFGKSQSYFDMWSAAPLNNSNLWGYDDTGNGIVMAAYTSQFGNGVSASIAVEDPMAFRRQNIYQTGSGGFGFASAPNMQVIGASAALGTLNGIVTTSNGAANSYGGTQVPDIVGALRIDQAWGSAQVAGLLHQLLPTYYTQVVGNGRGTNVNGGPGTKYGWAAMGGLDLNLPWAKGDRFVVQGTYTQGVMGTVTGGIGNTTLGVAKGGKAVDGFVIDSSFCSSVGCKQQLTTAYGVIAGVEHYWQPNLRSSLFGDYLAIRYNGNDSTFGTGWNNICAGLKANNSVFPSANTCNPNLNLWQIGWRTVWNPVANLDIGLETIYQHLDQNHVGTVAPGGALSGTYALGDISQWGVNLRVQRNFWN